MPDRLPDKLPPNLTPAERADFLRRYNEQVLGDAMASEAVQSMVREGWQARVVTLEDGKRAVELTHN
jgi:hypothetical protein